MNYNNPVLADELAKRYVLGTMSGKVRKRFEQLLMNYRILQQSVWHWEQLLNPMATHLRPETPDKNVWKNIIQQLGWEKSKKETLQFSLWNIFSHAIAIAASLLLVIVFWYQPPSSTTVNAVALLQETPDKIAWIAHRQTNKINIKAEQPPIIDANKDFELWMLPKSGQAPISLGLLPKNNLPQNGNQQLSIQKQLLDKLANAGLAVSIEPSGGSPTGQPTGKVILTANWIVI